MPVSRRINGLGLAFAVALTFGAVMATHAKQRSQVWHYAPNRNFDETGAFTPARAGFNLADVSTRRQLDLLPDGVKGLVWVGQCDGVTSNFKTMVDATIDHPKLFGFLPDGRPRPDRSLEASLQSVRSSGRVPIGSIGDGGTRSLSSH